MRPGAATTGGCKGIGGRASWAWGVLGQADGEGRAGSKRLHRHPRFCLPQRANKGSKNVERLKKKLSEQESLLLLMSPSMAFRVHNRHGKVRVPGRRAAGPDFPLLPPKCS